MENLTQEDFPNTGNLFEILKCAEDNYQNTLSCYLDDPDFESDLDAAQDEMNRAHNELFAAKQAWMQSRLQKEISVPAYI